MKFDFVNGNLVVTAETQAEAFKIMRALGFKGEMPTEAKIAKVVKVVRYKRKHKKECPQCGRLFKAGGLRLHIFKAHTSKGQNIPVQDLTTA
jgi:hypothetical protein